MAPQAGGRDVLEEFATSLRGKKGITERGAVLSAPGAEARRVGFFRGKDLLRHLRTQRDLLNEIAPPRDPKASERARQAYAKAEDDAKRKEVLLAERKRVDEQVAAVAEGLLQGGYVVRAERVYHREKPKDGRRRVKYPQYLMVSRMQTFARDEFYCWLQDKPTSIWTYVYSGLLVAFVLACCLLQVAPYKVKLGVLYTSMGLLGAIFGLLIARGVIFAIVWVLTGRSLWLMPNLLSDEVPISHIAKPVWEFDPHAGKPPPAWHRLGLAGAVVAAFVAFHVYAPDGSASKVRDATKHAHDQILDMLNIKDPSKMIGKGGADELINGPGNTTGGGQETGGEVPVPPQQPSAGGEAPKKKRKKKQAVEQEL